MLPSINEDLFINGVPFILTNRLLTLSEIALLDALTDVEDESPLDMPAAEELPESL